MPNAVVEIFRWFAKQALALRLAIPTYRLGMRFCWFSLNNCIDDKAENA